MSAPVDVLAVLDSLIEYHDTSDSLKGRNCIAARAAMAELIEQMRDVMALWDSNEWSIDGKAAAIQCRPDKWRAALERVGGAA